MLGMLSLLQELFPPPSPFSPGPRPFLLLRLTGFLGLLAFVQSLKGALPSFLGPELHKKVELGMFVSLSGTLEAPPPVWC